MSQDEELEELLRSSGIEINEDTQEQVVEKEKVAEPKKEIKLISPKEKEIVDFSTLIDNQTVLLKKIKDKLELGTREVSLSNTEKGIFSDLIELVSNLEIVWDEFITYFCNPPSQEEKELLNKTLLMRKAGEDLKQFEKIIQNLNLNLKMDEFSKEFSDFTNKIESRLSTTYKKYDSFSDSFLNKQELTAKEFENNITKTINRSKLTFRSILMIVLSFGVIFGLLFGFVIYKIKSIDELDINISKVSENLENIKISREDDKLIIQVPKNSFFDKEKRILIINGK